MNNKAIKQLLLIKITLILCLTAQDWPMYTTVKHSFVEIDFNRFIGHAINIGDKTSADWNGELPTISNSSAYNSNEYLYRDALYDDTGDGDYVYPSGSAFAAGMCDLTEFRATYDNTYLYLLIKVRQPPGEFWAGSFVIGIADADTSTGNYYLINGNGSNNTLGPAAEIGTDRKIDYTVFVSSTYKARMWATDSNQIGDGNSSTDDGSLDNMLCSDGSGWEEIELGIPISLINGGLNNKKFSFFVGAGTENQGHVGEVQSYPRPTEWAITGGDPAWWKNLGTDPDVMDCIGANLLNQQADLSNYEPFLLRTNTDESDYNVFNFGVSETTYQIASSKKLIIYFSLPRASKVTINITDLNHNPIGTLLDKKYLTPPVNNSQGDYMYEDLFHYTWNGYDQNDQAVARGVYIVEGIFQSKNDKVISREVIRVW
ncbi:MAG TPA: glucodextranase DOMON-like domain-containing protein [Spirochaetota bacterium]|nr:glucodextranase DOMON-like domain-containing protein [Spirochaetota bacterium]